TADRKVLARSSCKSKKATKERTPSIADLITTRHPIPTETSVRRFPAIQFCRQQREMFVSPAVAGLTLFLGHPNLFGGSPPTTAPRLARQRGTTARSCPWSGPCLRGPRRSARAGPG